MRVAPAGTVTLTPTAVMVPLSISTVAFSIGGPETGYTLPPTIAIGCAAAPAAAPNTNPAAIARHQ